jgi:hypothetical protein
MFIRIIATSPTKISPRNALSVGVSTLRGTGPSFKDVKGPNNVIADAFSRFPSGNSAEVEAGPSTTLDDPEEFYAMTADFPTLVDCFLNHPDPTMLPFPLHYSRTSEHQEFDAKLPACRQEQSALIPIQQFGGKTANRCSPHLHPVDIAPQEHSTVPSEAWPYWHDARARYSCCPFLPSENKEDNQRIRLQVRNLPSEQGSRRRLWRIATA